MLFEKKIKCDDPLPALLRWSEKFRYAAFFITSRKQFFGAVGAYRHLEIWESHGAFQKLEAFQTESQKRIAGFLGYDLKNDLENLNSANPDVVEMPEGVFFEPRLELKFDGSALILKSDEEELGAEALDALTIPADFSKPVKEDLTFKPHTSRDEYIAQAKSIQAHLKRGDIYEANYCIQFSALAESFNPRLHFLKLQENTEAPFSVFAKLNTFYILSASPERFLKNTRGKLISQPIKGTIKRSPDRAVDEALKAQLRADPKEQNENVMIVDLVRNDLSRIARRGTVKVEKLFAVETFKTVHHLMSTITAQLDTSRYASWDAIRATFPMGSMTGAPKISAMKIIEHHENFKRCAYSGAFGWIDSSGDFDFNVLIRSVFYNASAGIAALGVGSAITMQADIEKEYDECLLKAEAVLKSFKYSAPHVTL